MTAALSDVPPTEGWTTDDLDALPEDGVRRELLDGVIHVSPSPSPAHQVLAARLLVALEENCPDDLHVSQANDVRISARRQFIPDVLVTTDEAASRNGKFAAEEVVLAVEIVSPSSTSMDRLLKPALYAKAGVPLYWMIETAGELTVHTFKLDFEDEVYQPSGTFTDWIKVDQPWRIEIPIAKLRPRHL
jgi:Uma2 family endonuclease